VQTHAELIRTETLASSLEVAEQPVGADAIDIGDKQQVVITVVLA
jgi:hypothetical protein